MTDLHCHILPGMDDGAKDTAVSLEPVSYTHLDVYKRQLYGSPTARSCARCGRSSNAGACCGGTGFAASVSTALGDIEAGEWSNIAATNGNFGLEDGDYIGLPTDRCV